MIYDLSDKMPWYNGPTLCQAIDQIVVKIPQKFPLRICVTDKHKINGKCVVVGKKFR